ncbi:hypothetical protein E4U17_007345 [Claviceps sp. LM77 group G4]|nr:hypothetical protein E4U17_007345 [Claviceps sp. LM77 group G4]KAG6055448.1 hypothetical protein E4U33_007900 [Claviceps sp. LM78 group G4]KAG6069624.1 hypothetical protein E4U16_007568 [Claviceps sp. LM84 group G4]
MVKILSIFMATLAAISPVVQARVCTPGLNYCGSTIKTYGFSDSTASDLISDALYVCQDDGSMKLLHRCIGTPCVDGTGGLSDYCFSW